MATIRKRGATWHAQVRRQGGPALTRSFKSKADAQAWARKVEHEIYAGRLPEKPTGQDTTLSELLDRYLAEVTPAKRGAQSETYRIKGIKRSWLGQVTLGSLSPVHLQKYRLERLKTVQISSLRRELVILRHLFGHAHSEWRLYVNQGLLNMKLPVDSSRRERRLSQGEFELLMSASHSCRNTLVKKVVLIALQTGLRRSEILRATWKTLDLERRSLVILEPKNGYSRTIPLTKEAVAILLELPRTEERIFPLSVNAFQLAWERLVRRAGIKDLHFHDLRHEAISRFFERGLAVPEVALISGHRDPRMLFRYTHPQRERILERLDREPVT